MLEQIVMLSNKANIYIDEEAPWKLKKTDVKRMHTVLYILSEVIRVTAIFLQPFIPGSAKNILDYFNVQLRDFDTISSKYSIKPGLVIDDPVIFFKKIETSLDNGSK